MRMTCKIQFDPLAISPKDIIEALGKLPDKLLDVTFTNTRETAAKEKVKA